MTAILDLLPFIAWGFTMIGLIVGAARGDRKTRLRFPHPLSAWWLPVLLAFACVPPKIVDLVNHFWPDPNNQAWTVPFALPYGLLVTVPFTVFALVSLVVQIVRFVQQRRHSMNHSSGVRSDLSYGRERGETI
jgi:hypothetical protein